MVAEYSLKCGISDDIALSDIHISNLDANQVPSVEKVKKAQCKIDLITLDFPSIDKEMLVASAKGREIFIVQMYHSGTGHSDDEASLIAFIKGVFPKPRC